MKRFHPRSLAAAALGLAALLGAPAALSTTVDEDLVPGGTVLSTVFPVAETETYRVSAPAGSTLKVDLRPARKKGFLPSLAAVLSDGSDALLSSPGKGRWKARLPFPVDGVLSLTVGSTFGSGDYRLKTKLRSSAGAGAKGPNEDHREISTPAALSGGYTAVLGSLPTDQTPTAAFLTGALGFNGKGALATTLNARALVPDSSNPLGFGLQTVPVPAHGGAYYTDGARAALSIDLGNASSLDADFTVAAGGSILYTGVDTTSPTLGMVLRRDDSPAAADLAGTWFYASLVTGTGGSSTAEVGVLTLNASGAASGFGASTAITADAGGGIVPGAQTPLLRTGSFTVAADGTVTVTTVANLFGPQETWTTTLLFRDDILAGGEPAENPASAIHLLLRQGTGLTNADIAGNYLHFGVGVGDAAELRAGTLAFDGLGGFSGTETVTALTGGTPQTGVATTGTYSVNAQGVANFALDGGSGGTGIVGPDGAYLFTFSLGAGGVGIDLLLDLGN